LIVAVAVRPAARYKQKQTGEQRSQAMRVGIVILLGLVGGAVAAEGGADQRYGIAADLATYPQGTARQALASALEALDGGRWYLEHRSTPAKR
jgi:hypothetical protein